MLYEAVENDDPFESEEMMELQQVLTALGSERTAEECIADENDVQVC